MVFKHNKRLIENEELYQISYKHPRQFGCVGCLASVAKISSSTNALGDLLTSDGERKEFISQFQGESRIGSDVPLVPPGACDEELKNERYPIVPSYSSATAVGSMSRLASSGNCEIVRSGLSRQSFGEDQPASVDAGHDSIMGTDSVTEILDINAVDSLPWGAFISHEENTPVVASSFPYFSNNHGIVDYPLKPVAIGPNHQADIPAWRPHDFKNYPVASVDGAVTSSTSATHSLSVAHHPIEDDSSEKWLGTCVLPMPDYGSLWSDIICGNSKNICDCVDRGSIRCVRKHVMEAREKLVQTLGLDKFMELGFGNMGEVVAQSWSTEDEQAFRVVLSNTRSLGKSFWDDLHFAFPSRSTKELVIYYFNVFMLRRNAEQNRLNP